MQHASTERANPVPRIHWQDLTSDLLNRLETPLIVEGWPTPPRRLPPDELEVCLGNQVLWVYDSNHGDTWQEYLARDFIAVWSAPDASPELNVVDVCLPDEHFDSVFPVHPAFDYNNLLIEDLRTAHYRRSLVLSAPGAYTPMHLDSYGFGGWMYLIEGEKHWELAHADDALRLWDEAASDYKDPRAGNWPEDVFTWVGTLKTGELMISPPGFVHRVETSVRSTGFGGSYLPAGQVARSVKVWRMEQALGIAGSLDLGEVLLAATAKGLTETRNALDEALAQ